MLVSRKNLVDSLEKAKRAIPSKSTIPLLTNFLIRTGECLEVHGSNLDWGVTLFGEMEGEEHGFLAPPLLLDVLKSLSDETVDLKVADNTLTIKSSNGETVLNILPVDDYPKTPDFEGKSFTLTAQLLDSMVDFASSCTVKNPARPLWGAIYANIKGDTLEMVGTDQFSLSITNCPVESEDLDFIVSAEVMRNITKLMEGDVKVTIGESMASFECSTAKCYTRLIQGSYYPYRQAIPSEFVATVEADKLALLNAVTRGSIVASEEDRALRLIVDNTFTIKSQSEKGRMEESVESTITGNPIELWVQHKYLSTALKKLSDRVTLSVSGTVRPLKVSDSGNGFFIIMPMSAPKGA